MMEPGEALRAGRRAIDGVAGVQILGDLVWDAQGRLFHFPIRIHIEPPPQSSLVPAATNWYVLVDPAYPLGSIKIHPAKRGGIDRTFPHQSRNGPGAPDAPFRSGDLCLASPLRTSAGARLSAEEPFDPHARLSWHVRRARAWLEAAACGALLQTGDHYELPVFPSVSSGKDHLAVVFSEGEDNLARFHTAGVEIGLAELVEIPSLTGRRFAVLAWTDLKDRVFARPRWGEAILEATDKRLAAWLLLPSAPVLPPWQAPVTWGELRRAIPGHRARLDEPLRRLAPRFRDQNGSLLLVGFPIPERVGEPARELHWQPIEMPQFAPAQMRKRRDKRGPFLPGFRDNALGRWQYVRQGPLADWRRLTWRAAENWHPDRIGARGRIDMTVRLARIAVIGVGAVGSLVAELLVRMGAEDLVLVDDETLAIGNLARHRLRMDALGESKASALAEKLNITSPHARVRAHPDDLPWGAEEARRLLEDRQMVLDCTGENPVLAALAACRWDEPKLFASISLGRASRRLYFFSARGTTFPVHDFDAQLRPWLDEDARATADQDLVWEGAGCWHPLSPARCDDIFMLGAAAVRLLEAEATAAAEGPPRLQVFERRVNEAGGFDGLARAEPESIP